MRVALETTRGSCPSGGGIDLKRSDANRSCPRRAFLVLCGLCLVCLGSLIGCGNAQEKSARHFADAEHWAAVGKTNEAIVEYRRAIQLNPKDPKAHLALAKIFMDRQESPSAYQQLQAVRKNAPDNHEANVMIANIMLKAHDFAKAKEQAEALISKNPDDTDALLVLAESSFATKDLAAANSAIDRVLQLDPKNGRAWYLKAISQLYN